MAEADDGTHLKMISGAIIAVKHSNKLLLLRRSHCRIRQNQKGKERVMWEFPTGKFNAAANGSMDDTALRELKEETGLTAKRIKYLGSFIRREGEKILIGYAYAATAYTDKIKLSEEHTSYMWATKEEILRMQSVSIDTLTVLKQFKDI